MLQFQVKETILDDEITLLKPLGYNFITFYLPKLNKLVIFDPALQIIIKSFEVHYIQDYEFSNDKKYLFTHGQDIIRIYQIQDDQCFLLREIQRNALIPISFLQNVILCLKSYYIPYEPEFDYDSSFEDFDQDLHQNVDNNSQQTEDKRYYEINYREMQIVDFQRNSLQSVIYHQFKTYVTLNNFYLLIDDSKYQVMSKNKRLIQYSLGCGTIYAAHQLKYSNFYITFYFRQLMIMIKQSKDCKIIRKIELQENSQTVFGYSPIINYSQAIHFLDFEQKYNVQIINLWDLNKQICTIDPFKDFILTQNTNFLVSSEGKCLKIMKMN